MGVKILIIRSGTGTTGALDILTKMVHNGFYGVESIVEVTNVGTEGHCDYGHHVDSIIRNDCCCAPEPVKPPSWQKLNRGMSKKQRRLLK